MTTVQLLQTTADGTIELIEDGGEFVALIVAVVPPGGLIPQQRLVSCARGLGYAGALDCIDLDEDGSEGWVIKPK